MYIYFCVFPAGSKRVFLNRVSYTKNIMWLSSWIVCFAFSTRHSVALHFSIIGLSSSPRVTAGTAVGYDNATNEILFVGAIYASPRSLLSFNLSIWNEQTPFIDHGNSSLNKSVFTIGQSYVQTKSVVYTIQDSGVSFYHLIYLNDIYTQQLQIH